MAKEIERKFLVLSTGYLADSTKSEFIIQGYLNGVAAISVFASQDKGYVEIHSGAGDWAVPINSVEAHEISQQNVDDLTVRLRLVDRECGFLTIKGLSSADGLERDEWEYPISKETFLSIASALRLIVLAKTRHSCPLGNLVIEVDEFHGLTMAEIEFPVGYDHSQPLVLPAWIGEEVTGNVEYYNSVLIKSGRIQVAPVLSLTPTN